MTASRPELRQLLPADAGTGIVHPDSGLPTAPRGSPVARVQTGGLEGMHKSTPLVANEALSQREQGGL